MKNVEERMASGQGRAPPPPLVACPGPPEGRLSHNVQRFATRRQARTALGHAPLDVTNAVTLLHVLGAVYPGARRRRAEARTALL